MLSAPRLPGVDGSLRFRLGVAAVETAGCADAAILVLLGSAWPEGVWLAAPGSFSFSFIKMSLSQQKPYRWAVTLMSHPMNFPGPKASGMGPLRRPTAEAKNLCQSDLAVGGREHRALYNKALMMLHIHTVVKDFALKRPVA